MAVSPLFLYTGPETGQKNDTIDSFRTRIQKEQGPLDEHKLYAGETEVRDVVALLENGSLFSEVRFIVLCNAELIKNADDITLIKNWLAGAEKNLPSEAYLFLVSEENGVDKKLENIVPKDNKKVFWELFENRKEEWLFDYFRKNGCSIEQDAVSSILEMVENNTEILRKECSRFFVCFPKGHCVTTADVENILTNDRTESPFTLFAAMADGNKPTHERLESSLTILQKIRQSKESSSVQICMLLASCFKKLAVWHSIHGESASEFDLKINGFSSKKMQTQYRSAARLWNRQQTDTIVALLAKTDMDIRSGGTAVEDVLLDTLMYEILMKGGRPMAPYTLL